MNLTNEQLGRIARALLTDTRFPQLITSILAFCVDGSFDNALDVVKYWAESSPSSMNHVVRAGEVIRELVAEIKQRRLCTVFVYHGPELGRGECVERELDGANVLDEALADWAKFGDSIRYIEATCWAQGLRWKLDRT